MTGNENAYSSLSREEKWKIVAKNIVLEREEQVVTIPLSPSAKRKIKNVTFQPKAIGNLNNDKHIMHATIKANKQAGNVSILPMKFEKSFKSKPEVSAIF